MAGFNFLVCDSSIDRRIRLKQIASSVQDFGEMHQAVSTEAALKELGGGARLDVVFVGGDMPLEAFSAFVKDAKSTLQGKECAYVIVLKGQVQKRSERAPLLLAGADSVLCEPFSVEQLVEIVNVASDLRKQREEERARQAVRLILSDSIATLDAVAMLKSVGCEPGTSVQELHQLGRRVHTLLPEMLPMYFDMMVDKFEQALPPPEKPETKLYKGASLRVKRMVERKIREELEERISRGE